MLFLLPMVTVAQDVQPQAQVHEADSGVTPEAVHQEIGSRMMQYVDELNQLAIVSSMQVTFLDGAPLSSSYINALKDKISMLDERYNSINVRWTTFTQAMQMDIADDEELMSIMSNVEQLKQILALFSK